MATAEAFDPETTGISSPCTVRRRALVCEDDPAICALLRTLLAREGEFEVVTCADGTALIPQLDTPFDVIILDLMMPGMSGHDVLEHLERTNPAMFARVIVITAQAIVKRKPLKVPVAQVLIKPFDIVDFMDAVRTVANGDS